ncbi:hypothetical protein JRI60_44425 [Archangium violaceum]|uniref:hypothetical protein n=1 Tax=Archangium violaceum TaxID=83451 RepID=UPI001951A973|nr:hypothetical protein [Archangium violaceum]QRN96004.1 hypothetical protein JRI60_44425 [Archangium violaceum]
MLWTYDLLWAKAASYMEKALAEPKDGAMFPFWASLAMEFLARAALASKHPVLLADPANEKNILYTFGVSSPDFHPKSIGVALVFERCRALMPDFLKEHASSCLSLANSRNEELHSGGKPFEKYETKNWLGSYYAACVPLLKFQGKSLQDFLGAAEAKAAEEMLKAKNEATEKKVKKLISSHANIFENKPEPEKAQLRKTAEIQAEQKRYDGGHLTQCPACQSNATVTGEVVNTTGPNLEQGYLVFRSSVLPTGFHCAACGLTLDGHAALHAAGLGGQFTRTSKWDPLDYYVVTERENEDEDEGPHEEYNNE